MNFRVTTILAVILILVCSLVIFLKTRPDAPKIDTSLEKAVLSPAPKDITAISFRRGADTQPAVAFAKTKSPKGEVWNLTAPTKAPAEDYRVSSIAATLKDLRFDEKFEPEPTGSKSLAYTGLDSPRYVVTFSDEGGGAGKEHTLNVGKRNTAQKYFATIDTGKTIYVLERNVIEDLDKPAAEFRSKQLANVDKAAIAVIKITHGKESLTLSKVGETGGGWIITAPLPARADSKLVDDIVYQLANGKADEFTELAPSSAIGLTAPQLTIQAFAAPPSPPATTTASSQPAPPPAAPAPLIALQIGSYSDPLNKDKVYAVLAGSSEVFTLPADAFSKFNKSLNDLIDHSVFASTAGVAEATLLSIEPANGPQSPIFLRKEADSWNLRFANPAGTAEAPGLAGDPAAVAPLLESLKNLRASKIVTGAGDLKAIGLDPPTLTVTLQLPRAISTTTLLAGKEQKDPTGLALTPVMIRGEQTVYMIGSDELKPILAANPLELRSKTVADFVANDIESITIEHWGKHGKLITLTRDQAKWSLRDSGAANNYAPNAADAGKVTSLLAEFNPLTAAKWLSNGVAELNAKNPPEITVTLAVSKEVLGPPAPPPTHPATSSQPSTTSAPAPAPPTLPRGPAVTHTLELFSRPAPATAPATSPATSPATTSAPAVLWTARLKGVAGEFEPTPNLIEYLTKTTYRAPPAPPSPAATTTSPAATDPATTSATTPAK